VLREVDQLVTQGHSPVHFARQFVRFLRNAIVAKVASGDSPLLQVSADERARAARIAAMFSEEDLTRFLQIMLRTHSELGYKQEQRFHLELGLLKLVHAQRLLPLEEMLSGETIGKGTAASAPRATAPASVAAAPARSAPPPRSPGPSPFEADRARKSGLPKSEMSSAAATAVAVAEPPAAPSGTTDVAHMRDTVLSALESANLHTIAVLLENAEWHVQSNEVLVRVAEKQAIVNMANAPDPRRVATTAATEAAGRPIKFRVEADASAQPANGGNGATAERREPSPPRAGRSRALEDPIVRRMQEKFGAEVRTVIDHRDKSR
jgi:DNA polymerase-3 subunit gamma/tau